MKNFPYSRFYPKAWEWDFEQNFYIIYMNKILFILAFVSFVLLACSKDPEPTHPELCAKAPPITKECLVGRWSLDDVLKNSGGTEISDAGCRPGNGVYGSLTFKSDGQFSFEMGDLEKNGYWKLNEKGTEMKIECPGSDCDIDIPEINAKISIKNSNLRVTSTGYTSFSQCKTSGSAELIEVFGWQGAK